MPPHNQAKLWQLISPALPIGAYHYSQGLEQAVQRKWIRDRTDAAKWISELLHHSIAYIDLPIIYRAHGCWNSRDSAGLRSWDDVCRSYRETSEMRDEEEAMGRALMRLAKEFDQPIPSWRPGYVVAFSIFAANAGVSGMDALSGYAWTWCENQVLSATKLIPLGHTEGQRVVRDLIEQIPIAVESALACADDDIGNSAPGLTLASMWHETQYSRVFRS